MPSPAANGGLKAAPRLPPQQPTRASPPKASKSESDAAPAEQHQAGEVLIIKGLLNSDAFNGKFALAVTYDARTNAWTCLVESDIPGALFRRVHLKPSNLATVPASKQVKAKRWATNVRAGGRKPTRAAKTSRIATSRPRSQRKGKATPKGEKGGENGGSASSPEEASQSREEVRKRLMQPIAAHPPRPKAARTERSREAAASVAHLKDPFDDRAETNVPLSQRAPFFVQGATSLHASRRRTHRSRGHFESLSANKQAGWTTDERILHPKTFRGTAKEKWDFERYPEDPIEPDWKPMHLQEAWAPETPGMAEKLLKLRSKLRGVALDDPSIQPAGDPNGPDLYC